MQDNLNPNPGQSQQIVDAIYQDLQRIKYNVLTQLMADVDRLQADKGRLQQEILELQNQNRQLAAQQQELVQHFSSMMVNQVQDLVSQRMQQLIDTAQSPPPRTNGMNTEADHNEYASSAYRLLASLDQTLRSTFRSLQQDLSSYQSSLSQQISNMYSLEQQGEAIISALVEKLRQEVSPTVHRSPTTEVPSPIKTIEPKPVSDGWPNRNNYAPLAEDLENLLEEEEETPAPEPARPGFSLQQIGLILALLSSVALSLQNVIFRVMLKKSNIFGMFSLGGFIAPGTGNSLLILWMRMLVVVPMMMVIGWIRYPNLFYDLQDFASFSDREKTWNTIGSGFFLFLSQVTIFLAFGQIPTGVVTTIFFIYPIITVLLSWLLFGDRPSVVRTIITIVVFLGVVLISLPGGAQIEFSPLGIALAVVSGVAFALYVILTQAAQKKIHPVPFSVINFIIILVFSGLTLMAPFLPPEFNVKINPQMWSGIVASALVLGSLTLAGYLMTNIGINMIGAAPFSVIGATGPALTSLMAFVIIQESLKMNQILGMLLVTAGVVALSVERLRSQRR